MNKYPNNLKARRLKRNITQKELAKKVGVSLRMIRYYEQGERNLANAPCDRVFRYAAALQCPLSELFIESDFKTWVMQYEANLIFMYKRGIK